MNQDWIAKAALYELLSLALRYPERGLAEALSSGEYGEALSEACEGLGLPSAGRGCVEALSAYVGADAEEVFRVLRREHTRLFIGVDGALVSPYAGIHYAQMVGVQPALFVNREAMGVERFARACGLARPEGTNEPLDHIATELEFLEYLCLDRAGVVNLGGGVVPEGAYERFWEERFAPYAKRIAAQIAEHSIEPLFRVVSATILAFPEACL